MHSDVASFLSVHMHVLSSLVTFLRREHTAFSVSLVPRRHVSDKLASCGINLSETRLGLSDRKGGGSGLGPRKLRSRPSSQVPLRMRAHSDKRAYSTRDLQPDA